jgi:predicted Rossmann fold nucleotide-binding protein DprA/Smf involved in DNA uptake
MDSNQYLGWLALALTPGFGAMAGKLLLEMGSPEAILNASLTDLEAHRLSAAVGHSVRLLTWDEPEYPRRLARFTTLPHCCMCAETLNF